MKFKVWDSKRKEWMKDSNLYMKSDGKFYAGDLDNPSVISIPRKYICFSTGLIDINKKEIFEKDIVRIWGGAYAFGTYEYDEIHIVGDIRQSVFELAYMENVEIIGNVFEKPNLAAKDYVVKNGVDVSTILVE